VFDGSGAEASSASCKIEAGDMQPFVAICCVSASRVAAGRRVMFWADAPWCSCLLRLRAWCIRIRLPLLGDAGTGSGPEALREQLGLQPAPDRQYGQFLRLACSGAIWVSSLNQSDAPVR